MHTLNMVARNAWHMKPTYVCETKVRWENENAPPSQYTCADRSGFKSYYTFNGGRINSLQMELWTAQERTRG